jgi:hypothetical protein
MNLVSAETPTKVKSLVNWFSECIESLDQFGEYDQLQLIICAHELGVHHPKIDQKVHEVANKEESQSMDYVFQFLEQLVMMKYKVGEARKQHFFDFWFTQENHKTQSLVTEAYLYGYLLMDENEIPDAALRKRAVQWLKETEFLPSLSFTAWTVFYLDQNGEKEEAKKRFDELISARMENGSWNNFPKQTIQVAYPLSLTSFSDDVVLDTTNEFILSQPWDSFSGEIPYEAGMLKWFKVKGLLESFGPRNGNS